MTLSEILPIYEKHSVKIILTNLTSFLARIAENLKEALASQMRMSISFGKGKYLSLPYMIDIFSYFYDRVWKKLNAWKEKKKKTCSQEPKKSW